MNEMRVISAAFAASFVISADATSRADDRRVDPCVELGDGVGVGRVEGADHYPVGLHEVLERCPLGGELRVRDVADVAEPALVEPVSNLLSGSDRHRALHRDDDLVVNLGQLVDHRPYSRQVGVARDGRRRADRDIHELRTVDRLCDIGREGQPVTVPLEELVEPRLVDRHLAPPERLDLLHDDVADGNRVSQLGEACPGYETDVAGAEDGDPMRVGLAHASRGG